MNLLPDQLVYGVAPRLLIDCARQLRAMSSKEPRSITIDEFARALGAPIGEAQPVLEQMIAADYFVRTDDDQEPLFTTSKLSQLALAKISHGLTRAEADQWLTRITAKAHELDASRADEDYGIQALVVFGSYLGDKPVLGDLDIGVALMEPRCPIKVDSLPLWRFFQLDDARINRVYSGLRLRRPQLISIHKWHEVHSLQTRYRVLYGAIPHEDFDPTLCVDGQREAPPTTTTTGS